MEIELLREELLPFLHAVIGVVERRQTIPVLGNVRIEVETDNSVTLITTDLEVEMSAHLATGGKQTGAATVPARKLLDICRALPEGASIRLSQEEGRVRLSSGRSRFVLASLPVDEFPTVGDLASGIRFSLKCSVLSDLLKHSAFAMAQQDVRYYLTGLLLEISPTRLRAVATDGHRLALCDAGEAPEVEEEKSAILPRKAVMELERLLGQTDNSVTVTLTSTHARFDFGLQILTTKLIDGQFPDYDRVIPQTSDKCLLADRELLREALTRVAILANEKFRGVRLEASTEGFKLVAHNPENEEAEESISARYEGERLTIAFNATYLQDALTALDGETVEFRFTDSNSSVLLGVPDTTRYRYVIMPMRL